MTPAWNNVGYLPCLQNDNPPARVSGMGFSETWREEGWGKKKESGPSGVSQITNCFIFISFAFRNQNDKAERPGESASTSSGDFIRSYKPNKAWDLLRFHRVGVHVLGHLFFFFFGHLYLNKCDYKAGRDPILLQCIAIPCVLESFSYRMPNVKKTNKKKHEETKQTNWTTFPLQTPSFHQLRLNSRVWS